MDTISIIINTIIIAFLATLISGIIKIVFFLKQKGTYIQLLKFGLLGEAIGLLTMFIFYIKYQKEINNWEDPEKIIGIPIYLMLAGQLIGLVIIFYKRYILKSTYK